MQGIHNLDVAIFGGGIGGLWTLNRLRRLGYRAALFESSALGAGQTLASQGMIHGGQKYRGDDLKSAIAGMPAIWDACLRGDGEVDLRGTVTLSPDQVMWSAARFTGNLLAFLASKFTQGHTTRIEDPAQWPAVLSGSKGALYRLHERVLDVKSVLEALRRPHADRIYRATIRRIEMQGDRIAWIELSDNCRLSANKFVFCAGEGNEAIARALGLEKAAQRRPLKQILVRDVPHALYGHCVELDTQRPRVTITAHPLANGKYVWYLGAGVAEDGAKMTDPEAIGNARREMEKIFPSLPWSGFEWSAYSIDRAEAFADNRVPVGPQVRERGNALLAWATKLTFAPALAGSVLAVLERDRVAPAKEEVVLPLPQAAVGLYPWEKA